MVMSAQAMKKQAKEIKKAKVAITKSKTAKAKAKSVKSLTKEVKVNNAFGKSESVKDITAYQKQELKDKGTTVKPMPRPASLTGTGKGYDTSKVSTPLITGADWGKPKGDTKKISLPTVSLAKETESSSALYNTNIFRTDLSMSEELNRGSPLPLLLGAYKKNGLTITPSANLDINKSTPLFKKFGIKAKYSF